MLVPQLDTQGLPKLLEVMGVLNQQEFLLMNANGRIEYATPNAAAVFNWQRGDLLGVTLPEVLGESLSQKLLREKDAKRNWLVVEHKLPQPGGDSLTAQISLLFYVDQVREKEGILLAVTPISSAEAQERFSSLGEITASIAHEIRNPLAGILTTTETLREDFDPQDERREYLERIIVEINRVNLFLVKFLALARPQKPQLALASLSEILDHVLFLEKKEIERCQIKVAREYEPGFPNILVDAHQIQQVFLNLILNAVQAMPKEGGGVLRLRISREKGADGKLSCARIDVIDNGTGIAPRELKKIFLPLFSTKPKGVGLGLSVSQQILKEHWGELRVNSKPGEGTTFTLSLPLRKQ